MDINSWAYQLQNIEISQIAEDRVSQLIVMDYSADGSSDSEFTSEQISRIKSSEKKVIVFDLVLIGSHFGESTVATP